MKKQGCIYCLRDPDDLQVKYIGQTVRKLNVRLNSHLCQAKIRGGKSPNVLWLTGLINSGKKPIIEEIEIVSYSKLSKREIYWMKYYRKLNYKLTNHHKNVGFI